MKGLLTIAAATLALGACSGAELASTSNVRMTVEAKRDGNRRFWVTLVDQNGTRWNRVRLGGKRCDKGPANLPVGREVMVSVQRWRYPDGHTTVNVDRGDLGARFC